MRRCLQRVELPIHCQREGIAYAPEKDIEYCIREVNDDIFLLACNRGTTTVLANFIQIPPIDPNVEVMFESPRKVKIDKGVLHDYSGRSRCMSIGCTASLSSPTSL